MRKRAGTGGNKKSVVVKESTSDGIEEPIACFVRVRPFLPNEEKLAAQEMIQLSSVVAPALRADNRTTVNLQAQHDQDALSVSVDAALWSVPASQQPLPQGVAAFVDQRGVYEACRGSEIAKSLVNGYNNCVMACGGPGTGRSYTLWGDAAQSDKAGSDVGLALRIAEEAFQQIAALGGSMSGESPPNSRSLQADVKVSFFELLQDRAHDLLCDSDATGPTAENFKAYHVRTHPLHGAALEGITTLDTRSYASLEEVTFFLYLEGKFL